MRCCSARASGRWNQLVRAALTGPALPGGRSSHFWPTSICYGLNRDSGLVPQRPAEPCARAVYRFFFFAVALFTCSLLLFAVERTRSRRRTRISRRWFFDCPTLAIRGTTAPGPLTGYT